MRWPYTKLEKQTLFKLKQENRELKKQISLLKKAIDRANDDVVTELYLELERARNLNDMLLVCNEELMKDLSIKTHITKHLFASVDNSSPKDK